jgi:hypothetical protein
MAASNTDIYRSHTPYAFVFIGKQQCLVSEYDMSITTRGEAGRCNITIPLDNIDTTVFAETSNKDERVPVEIWVGYLKDMQDEKNNSVLKQIEQIGNLVSQGKSDQQRMFVKRFDGFVSQPEWKFGSERTIRLTCYDFSQPLREYKWDRNFKDGDTEVSKVVKAIEARVSGIKIECDSYTGIRRLGEKDAESGKYTYYASGKSYWEILTDCAEKLGKRVFIQGKKIFIKNFKQAPKIWKMYYGSADRQKIDGAQVGQYFEEVTIRYGEIGESAKSDVVVDLYSQNLTKKGKEKKVYVRYPENAAIKSNTRHIVRTVSNNMSEQELRVMAENLYKKNSRKVITGNISLPFANNFLDTFDVVTFVSDGVYKDIDFLKNYYFCVNSIQEKYSANGYSQDIDFDSDPDINEKTVKPKERIAPPKPKPASPRK